MAQQADNTEALHIQRLQRVLVRCGFSHWNKSIEPTETRTCSRMMNAEDKWRNRKTLNLEVNENQTQRRSELKNLISPIQSDSSTQTNLNIDYNCISPQHNIPHIFNSSPLQQHVPSPTLDETLDILRTISIGDLRRHKEKEHEWKLSKLQQYAGLMDVVERIHEIMKHIIEEKKKKKRQVTLAGQIERYAKQNDPSFFSIKELSPIPTARRKDLDLSEEQWNQFDMDTREGVVPYCINDGVAEFINAHSQIYQSIPKTIVDFITYVVEQIIEQLETDDKDQEDLTNELERIVADGFDDYGDEDQSEHRNDPKHFINRNDGLRRSDSRTQVQAIISLEANSLINITKYPPIFYFTMQIDQMDSEETVAGRSYRQLSTKMDPQTTKQSIILAMKTIMSKQTTIESENNNKITKDSATKSNINKIVQIITQRKQDRFIQPIPNKNQEIQTFHNPIASSTQSPLLQNQDMLRGKLQN
ncbi:MAG: hypothetical protein EZS28_005724 [Streblomastix strix]|uniref:Uncharacterized protein n=1 Tax=Streblomastix strix TaxID=222440 RepID=A0A5J4WV02_9EUKA|nr:MAG: hypothetical protein EZS28_005724 [Streblomastix strix]